MLRLNIDSSSEFGRASTESRVPQFQLPGRGLSLNLSASNDTSLRGSTGAGWQDKLRLSLSMDFGRNSFEVSHNGTLRLANGFELNRDGIKRAPSHAVSSVQDSYADESDLASELAFIQAKAEHGAFLDGDFERVRQPPLPTQQHWSASAADFIMLRVLGRGASGTVQLAFHIPTVEIVALKVVNIYEDSKRHQMVKELQALVEVGQMSSSFVNFHGAYFEEGAVVLCIEYMNRGSLQDVIDEHGPLPLPFIISATRQIVQGLQALHSRNKMHRDIKPANFLLNHIGQVKLADFGILGTADPEDQFMHTFCGTQMYMSPERLHGGAYGVEGDIWSLGLCLMVCATGKFPFTIDSGAGFWGVVSQITDGPSPRLPESFGSPLLQDFIDCCLIKDPSKRWSAAQLMQHPLLKPKNAVDARSSLGAWLQFHKPDQARRQQDLADIELLIEKTKIVPFQSEIDRNSALINLVSRVADQFGLPDPEKSFPNVFNQAVQTLSPLALRSNEISAATAALQAQEAGHYDSPRTSSTQASVPDSSQLPPRTNRKSRHRPTPTKLADAESNAGTPHRSTLTPAGTVSRFATPSGGSAAVEKSNPTFHVAPKSLLKSLNTVQTSSGDSSPEDPFMHSIDLSQLQLMSSISFDDLPIDQAMLPKPQSAAQNLAPRQISAPVVNTILPSSALLPSSKSIKASTPTKELAPIVHRSSSRNGSRSASPMTAHSPVINRSHSQSIEPRISSLAQLPVAHLSSTADKFRPHSAPIDHDLKSLEASPSSHVQKVNHNVPLSSAPPKPRAMSGHYSNASSANSSRSASPFTPTHLPALNPIADSQKSNVASAVAAARAALRGNDKTPLK